MAGAALIGFLAGSGLWLTALILLGLAALLRATLERAGYLLFLYKSAYPKTPTLHTLLFAAIWPVSVIALAVILNCLGIK